MLHIIVNMKTNFDTQSIPNYLQKSPTIYIPDSCPAHQLSFALTPSTFSKSHDFPIQIFHTNQANLPKDPLKNITKDFCLPTFGSIYLPNTIQNSLNPVPFCISFKFSPRSPYIINSMLLLFSSSFLFFQCWQ